MAITTVLQITESFKLKAMIYLNFTDLSEETQNRLLEDSKKDVERKFGDDIRKYVKENYISFETMIEEEAIRNLYSYTFVFNIWILKITNKTLLYFSGVFLFNQF